MKPFDLEAAKRGEPIRTRDGRPVKFIAYEPEAEECSQVVALINGEIICFYKNGIHAGVYETEIDLFMAPRKRTMWVNLLRPYVDDYAYGRRASVFNTKEKADEHQRSSAFARIGNRAWPLEIEE